MTLTQLPAWQQLKAHRSATDFTLHKLFAGDAQRYAHFSYTCDGLLVDCSKNLVTADTLRGLLALANARDLAGRIEQLFRGDNVNFTEQRPALHMAARAAAPLCADDAGSVQLHRETTAEHERMRAFVESLHGAGNIRDVIHIGIGGPHHGPAFACEALAGYARPQLRIHHLSTVDGAALRKLLGALDATTTLAVVASKSFTTAETLANAREVWRWMAHSLGSEQAPADHFAAATCATDAAAAFGISPERTFYVWPWIGGRYSLCSAMGLPVALCAGMAAFEQLRKGAAAMDRHFRATPLEKNIPVILGLLDVWYANFFDCEARVVLPYVDCFDRLVPCLQQVEMESLGKQVTRDGTRVDYATGMMTWGGAATHGQHTFMQLLAQGTRFAPVDIIAACRAPHGVVELHRSLLANALAQAEARMLGQSEQSARASLQRRGISAREIDGIAPHLVLPGNLPSTTILLPEADPCHVGMLLALYEHKVFVESVIWDINAFDQWGVEFAKELSTHIDSELASPSDTPSDSMDSSTRGLIRHIRMQQLDRSTP